MKNSFYSFIFLFFATPNLMAQGQLAKKVYQNFNADNGGWITTSKENWTYDLAGQEILYTSWNNYQGPFAPYNQTRLESVYLPTGELAFQKNRSWGDTVWQENLATFQYDAANNLVDIIYKNEDSGSEMIAYQRTSYEVDDANHSQSVKYYSATQTPSNWLLEDQRDSFFDDNDCLTKLAILNYDQLGEKINQRCTIKEVDENCQLQSSGYWLLDILADSMYLHTRHRYIYSNNDKTQADIYERKNQQTGEWTTQHLVERTVDEAGREIRYFYENYKPTYTDTTLKITTYTAEGELETFKEYKTAHQSNDRPLYIIRFDSLAYEYNDDNKLVKKTELIEYYSGTPRKITTQYDYYCNGQLKSETIEELPHISRIQYEYYGKSACDLVENEAPTLTIYPNPSDGHLTIRSNLLLTSAAKIELHSVMGQLLFEEKINRIAPAHPLDFSNLPKGQYILTISNDEDRISEKLIIH